MKIIKYNLCMNVGDDMEITTPVCMNWSEANEEIAKREAYKGKYIVEDDGVEEDVMPTQLDRVEAQVTYTAMMTDTLLEA